MATIIYGNGYPMLAKNINRNDRCRCGSGKKTKHCCGVDDGYYYSQLNKKQLADEEIEKQAQAAKEQKDESKVEQEIMEMTL